MIISASRRTDIPAFYSQWFLNRLKEGNVYTRNPFRPDQVSEIPLNPEVVDCIVFWTKNAAPMVKHLDELDPYPYYFQYTVTGYGKDMERGMPDKEKVVIPAFKEISKKIGAYRVIWRYDPIFFTDKYTPVWHLNTFRRLAVELRGYTEKCVISLLDLYGSVRENMGNTQLLNLSTPELESFMSHLAAIAKENGMVVASCAEAIDLAKCGIQHNCCIDKDLIERIIGMPLNVKKDKGQRAECGCVESIDIGCYNTCLHGCAYCYASQVRDMIGANAKKYNPSSPILCDRLNPTDVIKTRKVESLVDSQISLLF